MEGYDEKRFVRGNGGSGVNPYFSIIIPCCDVAPFVRECLNSLKNQSFGDWECIAVVESSKDNTEREVREFAACDGRFKVFSEPRSGSPATPRNTGLDSACGEYVIFLDGDDMLADGALARLFARINEHPGADLYPCAFRDWREGRCSKRIVDNWPVSAPQEMSGADAVVLLYRHTHTPFTGAQFTVYRRAFLDAAQLRFVPGLVHEDMEFAPRAFYRAEKVVPLHEQFYLYRERENSIMGAAHKSGPNLEHYARVLKSLFGFHAAIAKEPGFNREVSQLLGRSWIALLRNMWFSASSVAATPRARRLDTLRVAFNGNFGDFLALLSAAPLSRRIAGYGIILFVKAPMLRGVLERLLVAYGNLASRRWNRET